MTDTHSCSYYCDRPACIKAQRDELRDALAPTGPQVSGGAEAPRHPIVLRSNQGADTMKITIERETLERECDDGDNLLLILGLDPATYRTEGGRLNLPKIRAALAQQAEPDMRHPKIQALIGSRARCQIELGLVEQLLEDPNFEMTAMDMEYWGPTHDKLKERLTAPAAGPPGYVLVPIEPTPEMCREGRLAEIGASTHMTQAVVYRAMIAAAGEKPCTTK